MRWEEDIRAKCNELYDRRNALPRFDRTPEQEELFNKLHIQANALQWALGICEDWWDQL